MRRCNALFNKRGREAATMLASGQVYREVLNKAIEHALRKANNHNVLEDFMVRLDKRCDCGKFQNLNMLCSHVAAACKHVHHGYINYIHPTYTLEKDYLENCAKKTYWPPSHEPMISPDPEKKTSTKGHPVSTCIHTEMDIQKPGQSKQYFVCRIASHSKKNFPHHVGSSQHR
ncbi:hypothetical protein HKD37_16G045483 [Glycine soja]